MNDLGRFELIRRVLNHEAILPIVAGDALLFDIDRMVDGQYAMAEYAGRLRSISARIRDEWPTFPEASLPVVDIAGMVIRHQSVNKRLDIRLAFTETGTNLTVTGLSYDSKMDRVIRSILNNDMEYNHLSTLYLDEAVLRAIGWEFHQTCLMRLHGTAAIYKKRRETILYTKDGWYVDAEHGYLDEDWMPEANRETVRHVQQYMKGANSSC